MRNEVTMESTLAQSLQFIKSWLPESLVPPLTLARIERLADLLPFTLQVAFEARLAEGDAQVDVSQVFTVENGLREVLAAYAKQMCQEEQNIWPLIWAFSEQWLSTDS